MTRIRRGAWVLLALVGAVVECSPARGGGADDAVPADLTTEYAVRWEEAATTAPAIAGWLGVELAPDDGYRVEFWQREHDAVGDTFFFRLRTLPTTPASFEVTKKARVGSECTYACAAGEGDQTREVDATLVASAAGSSFVAHRVCSTSCVRVFSTRPEHVTTSPSCAGGPAEVQRWKVRRDGNKLRLERWARGDRVLWELSGRSDRLSEASFDEIAARLLAHGVRPLERSKFEWMCGGS
jgi:hypothetical protein